MGQYNLISTLTTPATAVWPVSQTRYLCAGRVAGSDTTVTVSLIDKVAGTWGITYSLDIVVDADNTLLAKGWAFDGTYYILHIERDVLNSAVLSSIKIDGNEISVQAQISREGYGHADFIFSSNGYVYFIQTLNSYIDSYYTGGGAFSYVNRKTVPQYQNKCGVSSNGEILSYNESQTNIKKYTYTPLNGVLGTPTSVSTTRGGSYSAPVIDYENNRFFIVQSYYHDIQAYRYDTKQTISGHSAGTQNTGQIYKSGDIIVHSQYQISSGFGQRLTIFSYDLTAGFTQRQIITLSGGTNSIRAFSLTATAGFSIATTLQTSVAIYELEFDDEFSVTPTTLNTGELITCTAVADDDVVSYHWNFGDGNSDTGASVTHSYEEAGVYTVTLTRTDIAGGTRVDTETVTVLGAVIVSPTVGPAPLSVDFTSGSYSGVWYLGDGTVTNKTRFSHTYKTPGVYTAILVGSSVYSFEIIVTRLSSITTTNLSYRLGFADIDIDKIMPKKYMTDQDNEEDSDQDNNKEDKDSNKEDTE